MRVIVTGSSGYHDQPKVFVVLEQMFLSGGGEEIVIFFEPLEGLDQIVEAIAEENAELGFISEVCNFDDGFPEVDGVLGFFLHGDDSVRGTEIIDRAQAVGLFTLAMREEP